MVDGDLELAAGQRGELPGKSGEASLVADILALYLTLGAKMVKIWYQ